MALHRWRAVVQCLFGGMAIALLTFACFRLRLNLATTVCLYLIVIVLLSLQGSFLSSAVVSLIAVGCLALSGHPKTGQRWSGQNRPTGRGRGLSCFILPPPVAASLFSYANSEDHI